MECIPAIDLVGGKCVRLTQGDYGRMRVYGDPLAIARSYEDAGLGRLHLVDLDGAKGERIENLKVLEAIASRTSLVVDFGGGIKDRKNLEDAFDAGAALVTLGSVAVSGRDAVLAWKDAFGADRLIIGCDARNGMVATHGWKEDGAVSADGLVSFYLARGLSLFLCTDITRDGMLSGPAVDWYRDLMARHPGMRIIASGGVATLDDVGKLAHAGVYGLVTGKALLEGRFTARQLKEVADACQADHSLS